MKLGMMQPYFFPYLGYWQLMNISDEYILYDDVNYIKGGWINRNRIKINGEAQLFGISIRKASQNKCINELEVSVTDRDRDTMLATFAHAYAKAPYVREVTELLNDTLSWPETNLAAFLGHSNRSVAAYMGIKTKIYSATELQLDHTNRAQQRIIDICRIRGCNEYINAIGGKELYDKSVFSENGLELSFLRMDPDIVYPQGKGEFLPALSILDVLVYNDHDSVTELLGRYSIE